MARTAANGERGILKVTPGNLKNSHLYVHEHLDFFPADCLGPAKRGRSWVRVE
jgi:hypothetical protein